MKITKEREKLRELSLLEPKINSVMVIYVISLVGAASSRDHASMAIERLLFAAGSRSHEKSRYFGVVSYEVPGLIKVSGFMNPINSKEEFSCKIEIYFYNTKYDSEKNSRYHPFPTQAIPGSCDIGSKTSRKNHTGKNLF